MDLSSFANTETIEAIRMQAILHKQYSSTREKNVGCLREMDTKKNNNSKKKEQQNVNR